MVAKLRFDEETIKKTQKLLDQLPDTLQKKVLTKAYQAALRPVARTASQPNYGFRDRTGKLRSTIRVIGASAFKRGKRNPSGPTYAAAVIAGSRNVRTAHLLESGFTTRGGTQFPGTRFLERAFRTNLSAVVQAFRNSAVRGTARTLTREARKLGLR